MKPEWKRFAPVGLYLSLASLFAALGFYIIQQSFSLGVQISLGILVLGLALFVLLDPQRVREIFTGRQARYGSNALLVLVAVLGILVVVNYLAHQNNQTWDLTEDKEYTLAPETLEILSKLPEPVTALAFYTNRMSTETAQKLLESYKISGKGRFNYQFIDPNADPVKAQAAKVTRDGTIVLTMGDRQEQITYPGEQEMSAALVRLANPGQRAVYFLTGHGEASLDSYEANSFSQVKRNLENKNYTVNLLNLLGQEKLPEDALAIIIAGPQKSLTDQEVNTLKNYAENGGSLVILLDSTIITGIDNNTDPLVQYLAENWNIVLDNDLILDPNVNPMTVAYAAPNDYGNHPITQKMSGIATFFPTARSIQLKETDSNPKPVKLAVTASNAWGETDFDALRNNQASVDQSKDIMGPLTIAVAAERPDKKSRLVVIGDSQFATDQYFVQFGNGDFIINAIDWAAEQESLINLTPKTPTIRSLANPLVGYKVGLLFIILIIAIPGLVIAGGIIVWLQRRRRG